MKLIVILNFINFFHFVKQFNYKKYEMLYQKHILVLSTIFINSCHFGVWVIRPPALIFGPHLQPPAPQKFSTSSTSPYLKSSHYDRELRVYGYFNHVDLLMPHVHVLKKQPYCLMCT